MADCLTTWDLKSNEDGDVWLEVTQDGVTLQSTPINFCEVCEEEEYCDERWPTSVPYSSGPGAPDPAATAAAHQIGGKQTIVCVTDEPSGAMTRWVVKLGGGPNAAEWQWHQL
jgi:hypothetical protein